MQKDKPFDISEVTRIITVYDDEEANSYLSRGWVLLHVGEESTASTTGAESSVCFTLGWTGNPAFVDSQIQRYHPEISASWDDDGSAPDQR